MSPRTREDAQRAAAFVRSAWPVSPAVAREHAVSRRAHAEHFTAMAVSKSERSFAAALRYAAGEAAAAVAELERAA